MALGALSGLLDRLQGPHTPWLLEGGRLQVNISKHRNTAGMNTSTTNMTHEQQIFGTFQPCKQTKRPLNETVEQHTQKTQTTKHQSLRVPNLDANSRGAPWWASGSPRPLLRRSMEVLRVSRELFRVRAISSLILLVTLRTRIKVLQGNLQTPFFDTSFY